MDQKYIKNFDAWNEYKKRLDIEKPDSLLFHEREIWWCSLGINLGDEEDGKNASFERPVLVIRRFNKKIAWVLPITSKGKANTYYFPLEYIDAANSLILSQLRLVSVKRFSRLVRKVSTYEFSMIIGRTIDVLRFRP